MKQLKKITAIIMVIVCCFALAVPASAAVGVSIGSRTFKKAFSYINVDYVLYTTVYYNSWNSSGLDVYSMVANITNNGDELASPYFCVANNDQETECCADRFSALAGGAIASGKTVRREVNWSRVTSNTLYKYNEAVWTYINVEMYDPLALIGGGTYSQLAGRYAYWENASTYTSQDYGY